MFGPLYLCESCKEFVSGSDLDPISNYGDREFRLYEYPVGQCNQCGGLCYEATADEKHEINIREAKLSLNAIHVPKEFRGMA